jgi:hypothetical protein
MSDSLEKHQVLAFLASGRAADVLYNAFVQRNPVEIRSDGHHNDEEHAMGKYFLAWLLGVPAVVLVLIYFFMR